MANRFFPKFINFLYTVFKFITLKSKICLLWIHVGLLHHITSTRHMYISSDRFNFCKITFWFEERREQLTWLIGEDFILYWANLGWGLLVSLEELVTLNEAAKLSASSSKPSSGQVWSGPLLLIEAITFFWNLHFHNIAMWLCCTSVIPAISSLLNRFDW